MHRENFTVSYVAANNCFACLPERWLRKLTSKANVVKVEHNECNYYLSWSTRPSPDNDSLCLGATFARTLNIKEGDEVFVSCVEDAPPLTSLVVSPKSICDREIVEIQCEKIQESLLNQINVVSVNQSIVAWVTKNLAVTLIVDSLNPNVKYGRLESDTELYVNEKPCDSSQTRTIREPSKVPTSIPILFKDNKIFNEVAHNALYRLHPLPNLKTPTYYVFVHESQLLGLEEDGIYRLKKVSHNDEPRRKGFSVNEKDDVEGYAVVVSTINRFIDLFPDIDQSKYFINFSNHPSIYSTETLLSNLDMKVGGKVTLGTLNEFNLAECVCVEIFPKDNSVSADKFRDYLRYVKNFGKIVLNSNSFITLPNGCNIFIKLKPESCSFKVIEEDLIERIRIEVKYNEGNVEDQVPDVDCDVDDDIKLKETITEVFDPVISECKTVLTLSLALHSMKDFDYDRENVLICGSSGTGKTSICKILGEYFNGPPYYVHTQFIDCKSLKGKKVEVVQKLLSAVISESVYYQYSILFFDDIDSITTAGPNLEENNPDSMNANRITDIFCNIIMECQENNYVAVVSTCTDINKVGKRLREPRGIHFFRTVLSIPNLEKEDRIKILRSKFQGKLFFSKTINWDHFNQKTEGCVLQDLAVLADKAIFAAWKRHVAEETMASVFLTAEDLEETLKSFSPASLEGVNLYKGSELSWSDIGGLSEVKSSLIEILHWPLKYPNVFKNAPIKQQSGILLYGMPGTGKTMLAGAIAKECGLNLISIKGPELLSKYIGASEEAVRNVFEKAHRAKPCIIFFDEFDSLAPRRGHDSTGVTDRVVNQLLTHLDGIEGREGVAVVASTSRPDLLDPALLRPGRLDKLLLCPLPNEAEREEILESLCRFHELETDSLNLKNLAKMSPDFTGADLNAVIVHANLDVVEDAMKESSLNGEAVDHRPLVTQNYLIKSIKSTNPSLSPSEREKYFRVYARFAKRGSLSMSEMKQQKATLA